MPILLFSYSYKFTNRLHTIQIDFQKHFQTHCSIFHFSFVFCFAKVTSLTSALLNVITNSLAMCNLV